MKVAAVHFSAELGNVEANMKKAHDIIDKAAKNGVELIVFLEFFTYKKTQPLLSFLFSLFLKLYGEKMQYFYKHQFHLLYFLSPTSLYLEFLF